MLELKNYGAVEINPLPEGHHDLFDDAPEMDWTDKDLGRIVRLRLLSDVGFPVWDVSYCHGVTRHGDPVVVTLPFSQIPKRGFWRFLVSWGIKEKVFVKGILSELAISKLI